MTIDEQTSHFVFWAAVKYAASLFQITQNTDVLRSPLFISTNLASIPSNSLALLKNQAIIALNVRL